MPSGIHNFLNATERERLDRLFLDSRGAAEGCLAGRHRNRRHGGGTEFADHRPYTRGDDPRRIDWKVMGRTERCFLRQYEDETNLRVYIILDCSASMNYGTVGHTKYDHARRLAAALGYLVVKGRDSVGLQLYADVPLATIPARHTFHHLNHCLQVLGEKQPEAGTATGRTLHQVADSVNRRALMIVLSDLMDDQDAVLKALAHFRRQHHDVIVFQILDPTELDPATAPDGEYEDLETGELLTTDIRAVAPAYRELMDRFLAGYRKGCAEIRADYRLVNTAEPVIDFLHAYLEKRHRSL